MPRSSKRKIITQKELNKILDTYTDFYYAIEDVCKRLDDGATVEPGRLNAIRSGTSHETEMKDWLDTCNLFAPVRIAPRETFHEGPAPKTKKQRAPVRRRDGGKGAASNAA